MKNILFAAIGLLAFSSCRQATADKIYRDDDGNFLAFRCTPYDACDKKNALMIRVYANDLSNPGRPDSNQVHDYYFCCDTLTALIDSCGEWAKLIDPYTAELKGTKLNVDELGTGKNAKYHHEFYATDSNRIDLKTSWKASESDSGKMDFNDIDFHIGHKGAKAGISFNSGKTLKAFSDSLQNAFKNCCL